MYQKTVKIDTNIYYVINRVTSSQSYLLFIHGAGSNHTVYRPFFHAFEKKNFIAVDIRNHGKSGRCPLEYVTVQKIAEDICAVIEQENIQNVTLIGNSLGATIAIEISKRIPKKVEKMVLFTLFSKRFVRCSSLFTFLATSAYYLLKPFSGYRQLRFTEYHKYAKRPVWYYPYLDIRGTPVATVIKLVKELFATPIYLSGIQVPTLIFVSIDDWCAKNSLIESDAKSNRNITLLHIKSNHVVLSQKYEEVISHVTEFLK